MSQQNDFVLYSYFRSSASYRVRIGLNLKAIPYEYRAVHLVNNGGEQLKHDYRKLNPSGDVPTLIHKGVALGQSVAILDYLDGIHPSPRLFPADPQRRALVLQTCEIVNSGVQPLHNLRVLKKIQKDFAVSETETTRWAADWITYGLNTLETFLAAHAGSYSFGDQVTAADCFVIPHLANADRYGISLESYPILQRIRKTCESVAAFTKAAPSQQPDAPAPAL